MLPTPPRPIVVTLCGLVAALGCTRRVELECAADVDCMELAGGSCRENAPTSHKWCAYPDASCDGGYRFGDDFTGDDLASLCAPRLPASACEMAAPSCAGLAETCGANGNDCCCASPAVPGNIGGSSYFWSYDEAGDSTSGPHTYPVQLHDYRLDKYEVTVGRFRRFVEAGQGTQLQSPASGAGAHDRISGSGWDPSWNDLLPASTDAFKLRLKCKSELQTWTDVAGENEQRPINCVNWYEAAAFCAWDGGYLPTEAEWSYAAAGGIEQRAYPWSVPAASLALDATRASYNEEPGCSGDGLPSCTVNDLVTVGSKPAGDGKWGHSDLAGNVYEWAFDWADGLPNPCVDCAVVSSSGTRAHNGGAYNSSAKFLRNAFTSPITLVPGERDSSFGIRCARRP